MGKMAAANVRMGVPPAGLEPAASLLAGGISAPVDGGIFTSRRAAGPTGRARRSALPRQIVGVFVDEDARIAFKGVASDPSVPVGTRQDRPDHSIWLLNSQIQPLRVEHLQDLVCAHQIGIRPKPARRVLVAPHFQSGVEDKTRSQCRVDGVKSRICVRRIGRRVDIVAATEDFSESLNRLLVAPETLLLPGDFLKQLCTKVIGLLSPSVPPLVHQVSDEISQLGTFQPMNWSLVHI